MFYKEFKPRAQLQHYLKCLWILEDPFNTASTTERIVPDGRMELIFHYGEPFKRVIDGTEQNQRNIILTGQILDPVFIKPSGRIGMIGARFHPHGFSSLFGIPAAELSFNLFDAKDILKSGLNNAEDKIFESNSHIDKVRVLEDFLLDIKNSNASYDFRIGKLVNTLTRDNGMFNLKSLACSFNLSTRQIERLFKMKVGLNINQFARLIRFQRAITTKLNNLHLSYAELCQIAGYYDQSHLIKEFNSLSGLSPGAYFMEIHHMADLFTEDF